MRLPLLMLLACVACASPSPSQPQRLPWLVNATARETPDRPVQHFVQRAGTQFVVSSRANDASAPADSCDAFNFVGWNTFYLMLRAADPKGRCEVTEVLDEAASLGLTVLRTWAFADGPSAWRALQRSPGVPR
jgi:hypothetical protein